MQFYSTAHFYPDGRIVWMSEGTRYQSTVDEWAKLINAPEEHEDDLDVYAKKKKDHNSMANIVGVLGTGVPRLGQHVQGDRRQSFGYT